MTRRAWFWLLGALVGLRGRVKFQIGWSALLGRGLPDSVFQQTSLKDWMITKQKVHSAFHTEGVKGMIRKFVQDKP